MQLCRELREKAIKHPLKSKILSFCPPEDQIAEISINLARLFINTSTYDDAALGHLLSCLGTLSLSALANASVSVEDVTRLQLNSQLNSSIPSSSSSLSGLGLDGERLDALQTLVNTYHPDVRMFALVNLIATIEHNMSRIGSSRLWFYYLVMFKFNSFLGKWL